MSKKFYSCRCYLTNNYFLKKYNAHVNFVDKTRFKLEYEKILRNLGCDSEEKWNDVLRELQTELTRRKTFDDATSHRMKAIQKSYIPLHPEIYILKDDYFAPEFLQLVNKCSESSSTPADFAKFMVEDKRIYVFQVFTKQFCKLLVDELTHFEKSDFDKGRPNTMNKYGILLNELGMDDSFITPLREKYLTPLAKCLFPEWTGTDLDSHKAFIVTYRLGEDEDLDYHYDNAEVTMNISLGQDFEEGQLYFGKMVDDDSPNKDSYTVVQNKPTFGIFHRGQHYHGALPITNGERYNMIVWMRSSSVRNQKCPMCKQKPELVSGLAMAEGFTKSEDEMSVRN